MAKYSFWDKQDGLILADGNFYTIEEVYKKFPFAQRGTVVLEQAGELTVAIDSLAILKNNYNIADELSDEEALQAVLEAREAANQPASETYANYDELAAAFTEGVNESL